MHAGKCDQKRDKKPNNNVHRQLRFNDNSYEYDDAYDDLYGNNVDSCAHKRCDRNKVRRHKHVSETPTSSRRRKWTNEQRRGHDDRVGRGRRHKRTASSDRDGSERVHLQHLVGVVGLSLFPLMMTILMKML